MLALLDDLGSGREPDPLEVGSDIGLRHEGPRGQRDLFDLGTQGAEKTKLVGMRFNPLFLHKRRGQKGAAAITLNSPTPAVTERAQASDPLKTAGQSSAQSVCSCLVG